MAFFRLDENDIRASILVYISDFDHGVFGPIGKEAFPPGFMQNIPGRFIPSAADNHFQLAIVINIPKGETFAWRTVNSAFRPGIVGVPFPDKNPLPFFSLPAGDELHLSIPINIA
jgi:hypothetical protein